MASSFRSGVVPMTPAVARVLRRCGVSPADLDDALQTVLIRLYRHWPRLEPMSPRDRQNYACCVAASVAIELGRQLRRRGARVSLLESELPDAQPGPADVLEHKQAQAMVDEILGELEEERRTVFVLYEIEQLSGPEIAEHLGIPAGTVASRLRKAREEFQAAVARRRAAGRRSAGGR